MVSQIGEAEQDGSSVETSVETSCESKGQQHVMVIARKLTEESNELGKSLEHNHSIDRTYSGTSRDDTSFSGSVPYVKVRTVSSSGGSEGTPASSNNSVTEDTSASITGPRKNVVGAGSISNEESVHDQLSRQESFKSEGSNDIPFDEPGAIPIVKKETASLPNFVRKFETLLAKAFLSRPQFSGVGPKEKGPKIREKHTKKIVQKIEKSNFEKK